VGNIGAAGVAVVCGARLPGAGRSQALNPMRISIDKSNKSVVRFTRNLLESRESARAATISFRTIIVGFDRAFA
jgi:hypothetical protein